MAITLTTENAGSTPDGREIRVTNVAGALNAATTVEFEQTMMGALSDGVGVHILDCAGLEYANSTGMGLLINLRDRYEAENSRIELCNVPDKVAMVFSMLGLEAIFTPHPDRATAMKAAGVGAGAGGGGGGGAAQPQAQPAAQSAAVAAADDVYHVMIGPVRQGFDAQSAAHTLAAATGLQPGAAIAILQRAPVVLFGSVSRADVDYLRRHVSRLAAAGLDLRVTQKPVDHMLKVQWKGKPDVQTMFKDG